MKKKYALKKAKKIWFISIIIFNSSVFLVGVGKAETTGHEGLNYAIEIKRRIDTAPGKLFITQPGDTVWEISKAITGKYDPKALASLNGLNLNGDERSLRPNILFARSKAEAKLIAAGIPEKERIALANTAANSSIEYDSIEEARKAVKGASSSQDVKGKVSAVAANTAYNDTYQIFNRHGRSHKKILKDTTNTLNELDKKMKEENIQVKNRIQTLAEIGGRAAATASEVAISKGNIQKTATVVSKALKKGKKPVAAAELFEALPEPTKAASSTPPGEVETLNEYLATKAQSEQNGESASSSSIISETSSNPSVESHSTERKKEELVTADLTSRVVASAQSQNTGNVNQDADEVKPPANSVDAQDNSGQPGVSENQSTGVPDQDNDQSSPILVDVDKEKLKAQLVDDVQQSEPSKAEATECIVKFVKDKDLRDWSKLRIYINVYSVGKKIINQTNVTPLTTKDGVQTYTARIGGMKLSGAKGTLYIKFSPEKDSKTTIPEQGSENEYGFKLEKGKILTYDTTKPKGKELQYLPSDSASAK